MKDYKNQENNIRGIDARTSYSSSADEKALF